MDALSTQIASRKFDSARKGYDPRAVDGYLQKVGALVAKLEDELRVTRSRIDALERQTRDVRDADTVVQTAFLAAADSKAKLMAEAESKAAEIVAEAESRAARMLKSAGGGGEAAAVLAAAKRTLARSEEEAETRRKQAEREAAEIIEAARLRAVTVDRPQADTGAAGEELQRLMSTLGALREAARDDLSRAVSSEAGTDAAVAETGAAPADERIG